MDLAAGQRVARPHPGVDAVIFDWGGTLTAWHDVDPDAEHTALAAAVTDVDHDVVASSARLRAATVAVWGRSRDHHHSATVADLFAEAGLGHDPELLGAYYDFWAPHTVTDADVRPLWEALHADGIKVGVLSNTLWPRSFHRAVLERDGVLDLVDGDVYSSEIAWTKPSPHAFRAAMAAVGADDPGRCVFVGDRLYDDVWGAANAGMRTVHVPHSRIPRDQVGHTEGVPDAVVHRLRDLLGVLDDWR